MTRITRIKNLKTHYPSFWLSF